MYYLMPVRIRRHIRRKPWCFLWAIFIYLCFFTLHFIYTAPGKANLYIYWIQNVLHVDAEDHHVKHAMRTTPFISAGFHVSKNLLCPERFFEMNGQISVNMSEISMDQINDKYKSVVNPGGHWGPSDCIPKWNAGDELFNRAMLLNIGSIEARKRGVFDCFIFHDVDLIPENNRNYYGCSGMPRRFREKLDIYGYRLEYPTFFGGVSGVTVKQFHRVNGFSNQFWGWGGEDDDFYLRIKHGGYNISSPPADIGRYSSVLRHHNQERQGLRRFTLLQNSQQRNFIDGLNSIHYPKPDILTHTLYTNISVKISVVEDLLRPT